MVAMTSPAGFDARAIETGDAEVWAGLLAAKERVDQEGVSFSPADLIDELNDPHLNAALDTSVCGPADRWSRTQGARRRLGDRRGPVDRGYGPSPVAAARGRHGVDALADRAGRRVARGQVPGCPGRGRQQRDQHEHRSAPAAAQVRFRAMPDFFDMKRSLLLAVPQVSRDEGLLVPFDLSMDEVLRVTHTEVFPDHWGATPKTRRAGRPSSPVPGFPGWIVVPRAGRRFNRGLCTWIRVGGRHRCHRDQELYIGQLGTRGHTADADWPGWRWRRF